MSNEYFLSLDNEAADWALENATTETAVDADAWALRWDQQRKRYNHEGYAREVYGLEGLPQVFDTDREIREPRLELDEEFAGIETKGSNGSWTVASADQLDADHVCGPVTDEMKALGIRAGPSDANGSSFVAHWYPQWTVDANREANVALFILGALNDAAQNSPGYFKYANALLLEADVTRNGDASKANEQFEKLGGFQYMTENRPKEVSAYTFPGTFPWTLDPTLEIDDPDGDNNIEQILLLSETAFGALRLGAADITPDQTDRFQGPDKPSNTCGIVTDTQSAQADLQFDGFRWKSLVTNEEVTQGYGQPNKLDSSTGQAYSIQPGRLACNNKLGTVIDMLSKEQYYDDQPFYFEIYGAWINDDNSGSGYPKMTQWLVEPVQNSFGYDTVEKADIALLYLEARARSSRGYAALARINQAYSSNLTTEANWGKWLVNQLLEENISFVDSGKNDTSHEEPVIEDGEVHLVRRYGKPGPYPVVLKNVGVTGKEDGNLNQAQEGHFMRCGYIPGDESASGLAAANQEYWLLNQDPPAGTRSAFVNDGYGAVKKVWFSNAPDVETEAARAQASDRPPYAVYDDQEQDVFLPEDDTEYVTENIPYDGEEDDDFYSGYGGYGMGGYPGMYSGMYSGYGQQSGYGGYSGYSGYSGYPQQYSGYGGYGGYPGMYSGYSGYSDYSY